MQPSPETGARPFRGSVAEADLEDWWQIAFAYLGATLFAYSHAGNLIELAAWLMIANGIMGVLQWTH